VSNQLADLTQQIVSLCRHDANEREVEAIVRIAYKGRPQRAFDEISVLVPNSEQNEVYTRLCRVAALPKVG
jgi:hypothetical protein